MLVGNAHAGKGKQCSLLVDDTGGKGEYVVAKLDVEEGEVAGTSVKGCDVKESNVKIRFGFMFHF